MLMPYQITGFMSVCHNNVCVRFLSKYAGDSEFEFIQNGLRTRLSEQQIKQLAKHHCFRNAYGAYRCSIRDEIHKFCHLRQLSLKDFWREVHGK